MDWGPLLVGFAFGLVGSIIATLVQRVFQRGDDAAYVKKVVKSLIVEIEEGLDRSKMMAGLADQNSASFGRIYTALWDAVSAPLAAKLDDAETLTLLHRVYHRFDLVNFNCAVGRPGSAGTFAKLGVPVVEENLEKLRARLA